MATELRALAGATEEPAGPAAVNVIHVAQLLTRTEERLLDTERELIEAVRRTIHVTEGMIALVRSTTATTHALMLPHAGDHGLGPCRGPGQCTRTSLHCACQRVAMAKDLVRVVEGLNRTAGRVNEATDFMIKLSNSLSPREALTETCVEYLTAKVEAAEGAVRSITQVQTSLQLRVHTLGVAAGGLWSRGLGPGVEVTPERDRAVEDLRSMMDSASTAVAELTGTADTLQASVRFLRDVLQELHGLHATQVCPAAGAVLLEQLECPVCYQASAQASDPMWACANGHVVCATCRMGVLTCPVCRGPLATRPALLLAAWASALRARCPWGCASLLGLQDRAKHHEACEALHEEGHAAKVDKSTAALDTQREDSAAATENTETRREVSLESYPEADTSPEEISLHPTTTEVTPAPHTDDLVPASGPTPDETSVPEPGPPPPPRSSSGRRARRKALSCHIL